MILIIPTDQLSEAEKLAQATVEEAETLKLRIAGLEERLEVCPASSTPLILPPSSSSTLNVSSSTSSSSSNSSSSSQERVEEDSPSSPHRGLQHNPESVTNEHPISTSAAVTEVLKIGVNILGSQDEALIIGDVHSEGDVTELREKLRKLQRELSETRRECSDLKEKEKVTVKELEGGDKTRRRRKDEADGKQQQQEMDGLVTPISEVRSGNLVLMYILYFPKVFLISN